MVKKIVIIIILVGNFVNGYSQDILIHTDSLIESKGIDHITTIEEVSNSEDNIYKFKPTQLIIPAVLIGVGVIGLESDWLKFQNSEIRDELQEHSHSRLSVDDFSQYAPLTSTYVLKLAGVKSFHNYRDLTIIAGTAYLLMGLTVYGVKSISGVMRPDGTTSNSFPSGHTATAFAGAELLRREYWRTSPWIGVSGYVFAVGTGFLRMYNNRHWFTDVVAGAGIGILCTHAAYWLYPTLNKLLFKKKNETMLMAPSIGKNSVGFTTQITF